MPLITLEQADRHLRLSLATSGSPPVYDDPRVADVAMKIAQAEAIILNYLKTDSVYSGSPPAWSGSPPAFSEQDTLNIQAAVLLSLEALYDADKDRTLADYMATNTGVISLLLMRLRDPALA
jgi:hypothetical protein